MDELKLLIEMVAGLPSLAVWVLVGYLVYKIVVIGSIYGLLRFAIEKAHSWLTKPKVIKWDLNGICVNSEAKSALESQLNRLIFASYINDGGVRKLQKALDDYEQKHGLGMFNG